MLKHVLLKLVDCALIDADRPIGWINSIIIDFSKAKFVFMCEIWLESHLSPIEFFTRFGYIAQVKHIWRTAVHRNRICPYILISDS